MADETRKPGSTRGNRALWLTLALVFLTSAALVLALWVRTLASGGTAQPVEQDHLLRAENPDGTGAPSPAVIAVTEEASSAVAEVDTTVSSATADDTTAETNTERDIVYYRHRNDNMEIAISFDDGPHPRYTPQILAILEEYGIKATFFMVGQNVTDYPATAAAVVAAGHEIGNHSFSHKRLRELSESEIRTEILRCEDAIATIHDGRSHLLRPPEGGINDTVRRLAGQMDYRVILWDIDTRDWAHTPPCVICQGILDQIQAGDIILMHDYIGRDSPTPEALRLVIPALLERGYRFVTVGELIGEA